MLSNNLDSMITEVEKLNGKEKAELLRKIARGYFATDPEKSHYYFKYSAEEAFKNKDTINAATSLANTAAVNNVLNRFSNAIDTLQLAIDIFKKVNYNIGVVFTYSQLGNIYTKLGKHKQALDFYAKGMSFFDYPTILDSINKYKNQKEPLSPDQSRFFSIHSILYNDYGITSRILRNFDMALDILHKSLVISEASRRPDRIGASLSNLGDAYRGKMNYQKAIEYFEKAIEVFRKIEYYQYLAVSLSSLAEVLITQEEYLKAKEYALEAIKNYEKINDISHNAFATLAKIESALNNNEKALQYLKKSEEMGKSKNYYINLSATYSAYSQVYENMGNYKTALDYLKKYSEIKDSIFDMEKFSNMGELLAYYEYDKKNDELKILKKDSELQAAKIKQKDSERNLFLFGFIFLGASIIGLLFTLRSRNKANKLIAEKNEQLTELNDELYEANETKDKFFSIIAHDLKSPFLGFLNLIKYLSENFLKLSFLEITDLIKELKSSSDTLYKLLENLLEWSRFQRGKTDFNPEKVDLQLFIKLNLDIQSEVAKQKEIELISTIPSDFEITADEFMLNTIVRNLVSNAIKFTKRGGRIEVGAFREGENNILFVSDTGVGIPPEIVPKLFNIEYSIKTPGTENEPSTGLGLVLCNDFVAKHDGKIWVESEVGKGSTFYVSLPKK